MSILHLPAAHLFPVLSRRRRRGLGAFLTLHRQRRALARLDDAALQDIGITRAEARTEARRPVWDAPAHWR